MAARKLREHRLQTTREQIDELIDELECTCNAAVVRHCVRREKGDPFLLLLSCARHHDLTIVGLRGIFNDGILGNTDCKPYNVLTRWTTRGVRPLIAGSEEYRSIRRVLIGYSGTTVESARTMKRFIQLRL